MYLMNVVILQRRHEHLSTHSISTVFLHQCLMICLELSIGLTFEWKPIVYCFPCKSSGPHAQLLLVNIQILASSKCSWDLSKTHPICLLSSYSGQSRLSVCWVLNNMGYLENKRRLALSSWRGCGIRFVHNPTKGKYRVTKLITWLWRGYLCPNYAF